MRKIAVVLIMLCASARAQTFQATPITDLGTGLYLNLYEGGLYEDGTNVLPSDHLADGEALNGEIADGTPFVFLGIGMSDLENTFGTFALQQKFKGLNPLMVMIDGGQASENACSWAYAEGDSQQNNCPTIPGVVLSNPYDNVVHRLAPPNCGTKGHRPCFTEADVRVVLYYDANSCRLVHGCHGLPFSGADAFTQETYDGDMARAVKTRYPNVKKLFIVAREYGGYSVVLINPEPEAYETGFSAKWTIAAQINQLRTGVIDPVAGDLSYTAAPWIAWGPYTWASGETPRSDGLYYCQGQLDSLCNGELDFQADGAHLSKGVGLMKWSDQAMSFFLSEPWFSAN